MERQRTIRKAELSELTAIMQVIEAARGIMRASGNMRQWNHGYPSEDVITADIEKDGGYVIVENSAVVGYFAFLPSPEPSYEKIFDGQWLDDKSPYHVIHRVASYPGSRHIFRDIMAFCLSRDGNIRISTFQENTIMQRLMEKHGFSYCGMIHVSTGHDALAYQHSCDKHTDVYADLQNKILEYRQAIGE